MSEQEQQCLWSPIERKCISLLQQRNTTSTLLQIHAFMLRNSLCTKLNLLTKFIAACSSVSVSRSSADPLSIIHHARRLFDQIPQKDDTFLCNSIIKAHVATRQFSESFLLYKDLIRNAKFVPNNFTFSSLAKSCGLDMAFGEGEQMHNRVLKTGFCLDLYVSTALVGMYAKFGKMFKARKVFDEMTERSEVSWTALFGGYAKCGDMDRAREVFNLMPQKDLAAVNAMIDAYVKAGNMQAAQSLFDNMPERNVVSWTSIVSGYCSSGHVDSARSLFDAMPEKTLISWNAMIGGYCKNRKPLEALKLFHEMQVSTPFKPNLVTIVSILPVIADLGASEIGSWVHHYVRKTKLDKGRSICNALIDMYAKCGEIAKARSVFDGIVEKETASWNALINGFAINGRGKKALEVFVEMQGRGFKPNEVTMIGVLSACNHSGLVEEGKAWFKAMGELGVKPRIQHYGCMIDLLGKAGYLEEAEKLIESMPCEPNGVIWSSFLYACGHAKDVSRAERVIKRGIAMEPLNGGIYVMLRNLYAEKKRWEDVDEVRSLMMKYHSKKEVGCSVIEVDGRAWEFVAGGRRHPQGKMLHSTLEQLQMHMKD